MNFAFWKRIPCYPKNMTQKCCLTWVLLVGLLSTCASSQSTDSTEKLSQCFNNKKIFLVDEKFYGVINENPWNYNNVCIVFLKNNITLNDNLDQWWPQVKTNDSSYLLYLSKRHTTNDVVVYVLRGRSCNATTIDITGSNCSYNASTQSQGNCSFTCFQPQKLCQNSKYDGNVCNTTALVKNKYFINTTGPNCLNCDNPVKTPSSEILLNVTKELTQGGIINPTAAVEVMSKMADLASSINESAVALSVGDGVTGVLVANKNPVDIDQVSFAYGSPNSSISIISSGGDVTDFSRSISVSKEAFTKAFASKVEVSFAAFMRFNNMAKDELNSTILGNEVLAVEMGASIANLTDKINISFRNMNYKGFVPACHSWNGNGTRPNWTDDGCETVTNGTNITCQCSHLTFFAILMTPSNETISSTVLNNLTIITQVGCGLSMFFLSIVLFMHFLLRRTKPTKATKILIHLVTAMFLLDFTFLINNFVAKLNNDVVCKIMAAFMHYFMLATFTWFAVQAFHLCLQLYTGGKIEISYYMIKVSVTSWILPSVIGVILLITGKYGTQIILTDNSANNVAMCWIIDSKIHYIVNVSYYALVFLFTFITFIIIVSWLFCLRRNKNDDEQASKSGKNIITILGLCCMLGISWGFAFFAYGPLQIPAYYIFTILNSFQGFFLFIYYYNTSRTRPMQSDISGNKNSTMSSTTLHTNLDILENPYMNLDSKK